MKNDGYTGRNFNRPGFQAMLAEAEAWKIGTIIVKDMSRFCRNYLEVSFYTEILFPKKQIRFIAINNSVRAMLRIEPKPRRNAGRRMTVISTRSVSANSAAKRFIRTAQGRGFATPTVQNFHQQTEAMFSRLVKQLFEKNEGVTEALKAEIKCCGCRG